MSADGPVDHFRVYWSNLQRSAQVVLIIVAIGVVVLLAASPFVGGKGVDDHPSQTGVCVHDSNGDPVIVSDNNEIEKGFAARADGCH